MRLVQVNEYSERSWIFFYHLFLILPPGDEGVGSVEQYCLCLGWHGSIDPDDICISFMWQLLCRNKGLFTSGFYMVKPCMSRIKGQIQHQYYQSIQVLTQLLLNIDFVLEVCLIWGWVGLCPLLRMISFLSKWHLFQN